MMRRGCALAACVMLTGCAGGPPAASPDPSAQARDLTRPMSDRTDAVDAIWSRRDAGREAAREELKRIVWQTGQPATVRNRAIDHLAGDEQDIDSQDTRQMLRLLLPAEPNAAVRERVCALASDRGWTELTPAIVRSWAKSDVRTPDADRPERAALAKLHPGQPVEDVVWGVFTLPLTSGLPAHEADRLQKAKASAWEVLGRIDPRGEARQRLLAGGAPTMGDPMLEAAAACATDLRCVPVTAEQLRWARSLRTFDDPRDGARRRAWWEQAKAAVAMLPPANQGELHLRNIEPIRWAAKYQPAWLRLSREALYEELQSRIDGRRTVQRSDQGAPNSPTLSEALREHRDKLSWADLITILAIDDAAHAPGVAGAWAEQIARDHDDTSTEYGGVLECDDAATDVQGVGSPRPVFRATVYPPRPTQRYGDDRFVASDDMLSHGGWAMAHYHFHAKTVDTAVYAGPGTGDLEYAGTQGRACVVVTPIGGGRLNVDYFQNTGGVEVRVDLGVIEAP